MFYPEFPYDEEYINEDINGFPKIGLNPQAREWFPRDSAGRFVGGYSRRFGPQDSTGLYDYDQYNRGFVYGEFMGHDTMYSERDYYFAPERFNHLVANNERDFDIEPRGNGRQRKFSYRSKQNKIDVVLSSLKGLFRNMGKLADGEVLRGVDTLRIDVKRFTALQQIEQVIDDILRDPQIEILKADFPVSQKNRFQKKGFIAYLKCGCPEQANLLHDKLTVLMDPKWLEKRLFRVNIAVEQPREENLTEPSVSAEKSSLSSDDGRTCSPSSEGSTPSEEPEPVEEQNYRKTKKKKRYGGQIRRGVWEHTPELVDDSERLVKSFEGMGMGPRA